MYSCCAFSCFIHSQERHTMHNRGWSIYKIRWDGWNANSFYNAWVLEDLGTLTGSTHYIHIFWRLCIIKQHSGNLWMLVGLCSIPVIVTEWNGMSCNEILFHKVSTFLGSPKWTEFGIKIVPKLQFISASFTAPRWTSFLLLSSGVVRREWYEKPWFFLFLGHKAKAMDSVWSHCHNEWGFRTCWCNRVCTLADAPF